MFLISRCRTYLWSGAKLKQVISTHHRTEYLKSFQETCLYRIMVPKMNTGHLYIKKLEDSRSCGVVYDLFLAGGKIRMLAAKFRKLKSSSDDYRKCLGKAIRTHVHIQIKWYIILLKLHRFPTDMCVSVGMSSAVFLHATSHIPSTQVVIK